MVCKKCGAEIADVNDKFCQMCGEPIPVAPDVPVSDAGVSLGAVWPEWNIEELLGKGSYGAVYKAVRRDHNVESRAAIKIISVPVDSAEIDSLRAEGMDDNATRTYLEGIVNDFVTEIRLMQSLKGVQNIVSVEDYKVVENTDSIGWKIYIRMELLTPFGQHLAEKGRLDEAEVIKLGCDICTALELCGKKNIIHRDIKPDNIFINEFGDFKLGDFGIARTMENSTGGLSQKGTFFYMAPEVSMSGEYDARVDIYSLGLVLYRLLNDNRMPFLDTDEQQFNPNARRIAVERRFRGEALPVPKNASPQMADIILRACAFDPNQRIADAAEFKKALNAAAEGTYSSTDSGLDKTTSVRGGGVIEDKTTSVRRASDKSGDDSVPHTFGDPKPKKKGPLIAVLIAVALVVIVVGVFVLKGLFAGSDDPDNKAADNNAAQTEQTQTKSEQTEPDQTETEQAASGAEQFIADAEKVFGSKGSAGADGEELKQAIAVIGQGLEEYPDDEKLRAKLEEYEGLLKAYDEKRIGAILDEADALSGQERYEDALNKISEGLEEYPDNEELKAKYEEYMDILESTDEDYRIKAILNEAKELAEQEEYEQAANTIAKGLEDYPDNEELNAKFAEYNALLTEQKIEKIMDDAQELADESDFTGAIAVIEAGLQEYPDSGSLSARLEEYKRLLYEQIKAQTLSAAAELAGNGYYVSAMDVIQSTIDEYGEDPELLAAYEEYKALSEEETGSPEPPVITIEGDSDLDHSEKTFTNSNNTVTDAENNDTSQVAQDIVLGDTLQGKIDEEGDVDFYSFGIPYAGTVSLNITSYMRFYTLHIFDTTGDEIWTKDWNEYNSTVGFREDAYDVNLLEGDYFIKVTGFRNKEEYASTGNYVLETSFASANANEVESNNSAGASNLFVPGETINGHIAINDRYDFYKFTIKQSGSVGLDFTSYMRYYTVVLYDTAGTELWYTDWNEFNETVRFREDKYVLRLESGSYYLRISGYRNGEEYPSTGCYKIATSYDPSNATETEPNNSANQAENLELGVEIKGFISINDAYDFYSFTVASDGVVTLAFKSFMRYYTIDIYNAQGENVWSVDNNEYNAETGSREDVYELEAGKGDYYIRISGYRRGQEDPSTGRYSFVIN